MTKKKNSNCIADNNRLITEYENLEFTQVMPSRADVKIFNAANKDLMSDPLSLELMKIEPELKKADGDEAIELQKRVLDLSDKIDARFDSEKAINNLILASIKGTKYKKGGFTVDSKESEFKYTDFDDLPWIVYNELSNNTIKLITIQGDERKN